MPWLDDYHRKPPVYHNIYHQYEEAVTEAEKWKKKGYGTRITKMREFKDRKGNWVYMFILKVREKKRRK
jgi:hypothetical protein